MEETTLYNLAINDLKNRKLQIEKELGIRAKELDQIKEQIISQREAKTVVYHEQETLEKIRYYLEEQSNILSKVRETDHINFSEVARKNREMLYTMEKDLQKSKKELELYEKSKKDIMKLEKIKTNLVQEIVNKRGELQTFAIEIEKKKKEIENKIKEDNEILDEIKTGKIQIRSEAQALEKEKKRLELYEKRLDTLKLSLLKKGELPQ